ncbi:protein IQ-DOMAIN 31-like [Macadamia integrifolia]|uniref:protein IQ-DOMAIN 31-like n=1 Tax=Macadamia integrifolia TaxID=60698 RepID=UPI001C4FFE8E|nr:protein IQ-DOMAIN 31-like [Macadamia integrifolia]XP_042497753.1 protein IQ-DOMAIN 31-like [Macadamia integrifolia]
MGKSPGKWIKTLLFGKKASKSSLSKGREVLQTANENETLVAAKALGVESAVDHPLISLVTPGTTDGNGGNLALENVVPSNLQRDGKVLPGNQDPDTQGTTGPEAANDPERIKQEQAATKVQAAFRGYLARRAFRALKGIIRLQALIRGHLVRRQAAATLRCMKGIVRFQALVRGRRIRISDTGLEVHSKRNERKALEAKHLEPIRVNIDRRTEKLLANVFAIKLLASISTAMPLHLQYGPGEPNSAWNWLECWTSTCFWEPLPQAKKNADVKRQARQRHFQSAETEPGRSKRSVRKIPAAKVDNGSIHSTSESGKPKRSLRKVTSHPVESAPEHPQAELEKVKRTLRKVSSSITEASDRIEAVIEKPKRVLRKVSCHAAADTSDHGTGDSSEKITKDTIVEAPKMPDVEATQIPLTLDEPVENTTVTNQDEGGVQALERSVLGENIPAANGELNSKEDHNSNGNKKSSRRASFPAKQEYPENGLQNTPTLPSYMAATASAKAKLRAQGSPRFGQDGVEKDDFTRRHSLPSSTNGKLNSLSPRTQKPVHGSGKGGVRDRSLLSLGDGNDKVVQADWRR